MERLTEKVNGEYIHKVHKFCLNDCYNKLGKLEDIEEELGIPLEVLFKALKERKIYIKSYFYLELEEEQINQKIDYHYIENIDYCGNDDGCYEYCRDNWMFMFREDEYGNECVVRVKDYGKTWSLDKKDLEDK